MRALLVLLVLLFTGCDGLATGPELPPTGRAMEPRPVYAEWWSEVGADTGITASMDRVSWYSVSESWYSKRYGRKVLGIWVPDGRIYIAAQWLEHEAVVKHEMLHEYLRGDSEHASPLFAKYDAMK